MATSTLQSAPDDLRAAYQVIGQLVAYEGQIMWQHAGVLGGLLTALLLGAFAEGFPGIHDAVSAAVARFSCTLLAVLSTVVWWSMAARSRAYYSYWIAQARDLEAQMPGVSIFSTGRELGRGAAVSVGGDTIKLGWFAKFPHSVQVYYLYGLVTLVCTLAAANRAWALLRVLCN